MVNHVNPVDLLILQMTEFCNIDCSYCYLPHRSSKKKITKPVITASLERVFESAAQDRPFTLVFHAGEPLTAPLDLFQHAADEARRLSNERVSVKLNVQTNGTLINKTWCDFFIKNDVKVGVSIDGPQALTDLHRKYRSGAGAYAPAIAGIQLLKENGIPFHIIAVLTSHSLQFPGEIYSFFKSIGPTSVGFNIDEQDGINKDSSIYACDEARYREFWKTLFRIWVDDNRSLEIREFKGILDLVAHGEQSVDFINSNQINRAFSIVTVNTDGGISTFSPELIAIDGEQSFVYGNVLSDSFEYILRNPKLIQDISQINQGVTACRDSCDYFFFCGGGSPSNKIAETASFEATQTEYCRFGKIVIVDEIMKSFD